MKTEYFLRSKYQPAKAANDDGGKDLLPHFGQIPIFTTLTAISKPADFLESFNFVLTDDQMKLLKSGLERNDFVVKVLLRIKSYKTVDSCILASNLFTLAVNNIPLNLESTSVFISTNDELTVDITPQLRISDIESNAIKSCFEIEQKLCFTLVIVRIKCPVRLVEILKSRPLRPSVKTVACLSSPSSASVTASTSTDDLVMVDSSCRKISLNCPISLLRLVTPTRSRSCRHIEAFDAKTFFTINSNKPQKEWKCPICKAKSPFTDLEVDEFLDNCLRHEQGNFYLYCSNPGNCSNCSRSASVKSDSAPVTVDDVYSVYSSSSSSSSSCSNDGEEYFSDDFYQQPLLASPSPEVSQPPLCDETIVISSDEDEGKDDEISGSSATPPTESGSIESSPQAADEVVDRATSAVSAPPVRPSTDCSTGRSASTISLLPQFNEAFSKSSPERPFVCRTSAVSAAPSLPPPSYDDALLAQQQIDRPILSAPPVAPVSNNFPYPPPQPNPSVATNKVPLMPVQQQPPPYCQQPYCYYPPPPPPTNYGGYYYLYGQPGPTGYCYNNQYQQQQQPYCYVYPFPAQPPPQQPCYYCYGQNPLPPYPQQQPQNFDNNLQNSQSAGSSNSGSGYSNNNRYHPYLNK